MKRGISLHDGCDAFHRESVVTIASVDAGLDLGETEELVLVHDRASGMGTVVAIDDTTLGPAIGGIRWRTYADEQSAIAEVRRLARVMTLKSAVAGIASGGAKSVIFRPPPTHGPERLRVMEAMGRLVRRLDGRYVPGLDMGTELGDLEFMASEVPDICITEPSEHTAVGVFAGIEAAARLRFDGALKGRTVLVQGVGHVGGHLVPLLAEAGAVLTVADVDPALAARVAASVGGEIIDPTQVIGHPCDVFVPCAAGRLVDARNAEWLQCAVIAGAANDVLSHRDAAAVLMAKGIDYVPDFLINSGGVVSIYAQRSGWDDERTEAAVRSIGDRVTHVLERSRTTGRTPLELAEDVASERLGHPVRVPD
jgi:leucine dehydrogenase